MQKESLLNEKQISELQKKSLEELRSVDNLDNLKDFEKLYLTTKSSIIPSAIQKISTSSLEQKMVFGKLINNWKQELIINVEATRKTLENKINPQAIVSSLPLEGKKIPIGTPHPISKMIDDIYGFFTRHGYQIYEGPEFDNEWYNFSSLNIDIDHPSRSERDTFYIAGQQKLLLRTHTSNCQTRILEKNKNKEIKVVSAGKVYRRDDDDATHSHQYTNCEIIVVGKSISLADLKGTLESFFKWIFDESVKVRLRPSFFPFTEPSFEVDCTCVNCNGSETKCTICKGTGWIELLGAGLIHPKVLKNSGYDSTVFTGFAAGMGVERIIMIKYGISDIRDLYLNDLRFLRQTNWVM